MLVKPRLYRRVLNPLSLPSTHTELLLLCMHITTQLLPSPGANMAENEMYLSTRRCWTDLVSTGASSIHVLQSGVLLGLFEFGHAIFPNVLYSIALCVQYATAYDMIDLDGRGTATDWLASEEQRRAWWALLILERWAVQIGKLSVIHVKSVPQNCASGSSDRIFAHARTCNIKYPATRRRYERQSSKSTLNCACALLIGSIRSSCINCRIISSSTLPIRRAWVDSRVSHNQHICLDRFTTT